MIEILDHAPRAFISSVSRPGLALLGTVSAFPAFAGTAPTQSLDAAGGSGIATGVPG